MTQSYKQIQKQIKALQRQAEKLRQQEVGGVLDRIKVAIKHYGLTAEQLGFGTTSDASQMAKKSSPARSAKYSDGQGHFWSGMGKRPYWLRDALDSGRTLEEFAIGGSSPAESKGVKQPKAAKKRKSKVLYSDRAGHTWSGMGPRPRWLKDALDAGKSLEEMTA